MYVDYCKNHILETRYSYCSIQSEVGDDLLVYTCIYDLQLLANHSSFQGNVGLDTRATCIIISSTVCYLEGWWANSQTAIPQIKLESACVRRRYVE